MESGCMMENPQRINKKFERMVSFTLYKLYLNHWVWWLIPLTSFPSKAFSYNVTYSMMWRVIFYCNCNSLS